MDSNIAGSQAIPGQSPADRDRAAATRQQDEPRAAASAADATHTVTALYAEHALGLTRLAFLVLGDRFAAEDVVQEAFWGLYRAWDRLPSHDNVLGYVRVSVPNAKHRIIGMPLITGDGTKVVAPFYHEKAPPKVFGFTVTAFSVRTGKPIRVLYQKRTGTEAASTAVYWVNTHGTAMIAVRGSVFGVQTQTTFTPLPQRTQKLFTRPGPGGVGEVLSRLPAW